MKVKELLKFMDYHEHFNIYDANDVLILDEIYINTADEPYLNAIYNSNVDCIGSDKRRTPSIAIYTDFVEE